MQLESALGSLSRIAWCLRLVGLALLLPMPAFGASSCKLEVSEEVPVTMNGARPVLKARINGVEAPFTLDTGAFWSLLTPAAAAQYNLKVGYGRLPFGFSLIGIGGRAEVGLATVQDLNLFNIDIKKVDFLVGGSEPGMGTVGVIGQNLLRLADVEYDLGHGLMRFVRDKDCGHANLAYWTQPGEPFSFMTIEPETPAFPHIIGSAYLNGVKLRVTFDTGAWSSIVGTRAAARAGIKPESPGVKPAGLSGGIGRHQIETWIAVFPSLKVGDEEIRNARLRFGDLGDIDMLLGADFFLSHRIVVSSGLKKVFFTYNGGPVFNLADGSRGNPPPPEPADARETAAKAQSAAVVETDAQAADPGRSAEVGGSARTPEIDPLSADEHARRGAASAARHDFAHALKEFDRACEIAPGDPTCFYQRADVLQHLGDPVRALKDLDEALRLKPDYADALLERAWLRISRNEPEPAAADLGAVDRLIAPQAAVRLRLADLYSEIDDHEGAVRQLDDWIAVHEADVAYPRALDQRCWQRAVIGRDLDSALRDCNTAIRLAPRTASFLASRAAVFLRKGDTARAIADCVGALKLEPKNAWALYIRGIAELHAGESDPGKRDLDAVDAVAPKVTARAKQLGFVP